MLFIGAKANSENPNTLTLYYKIILERKINTIILTITKSVRYTFDFKTEGKELLIDHL